jgi:hypothetical protein
MRQKAKKIVKIFNDKLEKRISKDSLDQFLKVLDQIVGIAENNHLKKKHYDQDN